MATRVTLDATRESVVVTCDCCPWWSAFAWTRDEGWAAGIRHQAAAHGEHNGNARNARDTRARRA